MNRSGKRTPHMCETDFSPESALRTCASPIFTRKVSPAHVRARFSHKNNTPLTSAVKLTGKNNKPKSNNKHNNTMNILATNKAKNELRYERSWAAYQGSMSVIVCLCMIYILCRYGFGSSETALVVTILLTLLSVSAVLYNLEIYLLNKRATETISVLHESLILEYHNLMFRHRKEIPLSAITGVEYYDYENRDVWHPYTLRVIHSGGQSCRIGISMTQEETKALAKKIAELAEQYV